uniref:Uncharacterized protein n=2 Tax=Acidianus brierleyi TaxID=41673 RepID=A0A2U9IEA2_9CREN
MRSDIYNRLSENASKKNYSAYKYTNELVEAALDIEESGVSLKDIKDEIIIMEKLFKYKRIIIVPLTAISNIQQSQWIDLGRGFGLLIRQMSLNNNQIIPIFISVIKFFFSLVGAISINNNQIIISFPIYPQDIQEKLVSSARDLITSIVDIASISANIQEEKGQIKVEITSAI